MAVAVTVKLAQASTSRPGEASKGSPRPSRANGRLGDSLSFEQVSVSPRRGKSRLSENMCIRDRSKGSPRPSRANGRLGDSLRFEQVSVSPRRGKSRLSENGWRPLFQIRELSPRRRGLA
ncbi:hypothetical protein DEO72_LG11g1075 [Vigna unguiculata]|uniref:Uncharacterized protein n=1 Tax=Vigna unguiculata TaxID=3917 RepID=A0A4D6NQJ4_VIGUN|nr:hypothetical protein DEO72_LG11g1075 [Vigna unguiculata]